MRPQSSNDSAPQSITHMEHPQNFLHSHASHVRATARALKRLKVKPIACDGVDKEAFRGQDREPPPRTGAFPQLQPVPSSRSGIRRKRFLTLRSSMTTLGRTEESTTTRGRGGAACEDGCRWRIRGAMLPAIDANIAHPKQHYSTHGLFGLGRRLLLLSARLLLLGRHGALC